MSGDYSRQRFDANRDYCGVLMQQGRVQLDSDWNEQVQIHDRRLRAETTDILGRCIVPRETPNGFKISLVNGKLLIGPGRIYVDGLLAENHGRGKVEFDEVLGELRGKGAVAYEKQPYFPQPPALPNEGAHLVYIDVWQREVTFLKDPDLVEKAVGVDTTARLQTVWQVKVLPQAVDPGVSCESPDDQLPGWLNLIQPSTGRLTTSVVDVPADEGPCVLPPTVGFRGLENRLYRVEIHDGGLLKNATFKWSRDNASVVASVVGIESGTTLTVDQTGRDEVLRFNNGDWIEITDDELEFAGLAGEMRQIAFANPASRTIQLKSALSPGKFPVGGDGKTDPARHTRVRRWDQTGTAVDDAAGVVKIPIDGAAISLEDGIQITITAADDKGIFRSGDYWVFAARTADGSVEQLKEAPPRGIHHHFGRLGIATFDAPQNVTDCRTLWPPAYLALRYAGGDGQEGAPGAVLACPLTIGVEDEFGVPKVGAAVRFQDPTGADVLTDSSDAANTGSSIVVKTDALGLAQVSRTLGPLPGCHLVEATLEAPPQQHALKVRYFATVAEKEQQDEKSPRIEAIMWNADDTPFANDARVPLAKFNRGLAVIFSEPMAPLTLFPFNRADNPNTWIMTLELPQAEPRLPNSPQFFGHRIFILSARVTQRNEETWEFIPQPPIPFELLRLWLEQEGEPDMIRCRFVLKGNYILDRGGKRPLDAESFLRWEDFNGDGNQEPGEFVFDRPGDRRKGGDFESWFWLVIE